MKNLLKWHKGRITWFKEKTGISDYGLLWYTFVKGVIIGIIVMLVIGCEKQPKPTLGAAGKIIDCMFKPNDAWCVEQREKQKNED